MVVGFGSNKDLAVIVCVHIFVTVVVTAAV